jgi:RHS repeat-associated protein
LHNGIEDSLRQLVWCDSDICEERDAAGVVTKRFFDRGVKIESGPNAGAYFYTRDHLGSIRELVDSSDQVRAHYEYDPFGRRTQTTGDVPSDFGFAGMFWASEVALSFTQFRVYDPELGRWLSRDPLREAEMNEGPNLFAYVGNNPVNLVDSLGLCCEDELAKLKSATDSAFTLCARANEDAGRQCSYASAHEPDNAEAVCAQLQLIARRTCLQALGSVAAAQKGLEDCMAKPCKAQCEEPFQFHMPPDPPKPSHPPKPPRPIPRPPPAPKGKAAVGSGGISFRFTALSEDYSP